MPNSLSAKGTPQLTTSVLWVMTITTGLVVANIYYAQPLLSDIASTYKVSNAKAGQVAMFTQLGYAAGLLLIVPLADMFKRKRLIIIDFAFIIASLLITAWAPTILILIIASFFVGLSSVIPQVLIPMVAHLAKPEERGKKIGVVMSGLLIGILLSRTLSGFVGEHLGWRAMFYMAAGLMVILWLLAAVLLPEIEPEYKGSYKSLFTSLLKLAKTEPVLRLAAFRGAMGFACFSAFWATLVFLLKQPQFNMGSAEAGTFGLVGAAGALAASAIGRLSDKMDSYRLIIYTLLLLPLSFIIFIFSSHSLILLVIGVIVLDMGVQATHIANQALIFSLQPEARNRINTVYMVSYFLGGSAGTFLATQLWSSYQWYGVCAIGILLSLIALCVHLLAGKKGSSVQNNHT
jgi:predicted MFS family arabinose efflux permease